MFRAFRDELQYIRRHREYLLLLTLLPMLSLLFFYLFFRNTAIEKLPIVVVDYDHSNTSIQLVEMIDATASVSVAYSALDTTEAEQLIRSGRAYAALIIPHDFERYVLRREPCQVVLYNNGTNISTNGFIEKDLQTVITTFGAAISLKTGQSLAQIIPVRIEQQILFNPTLDYAAYLAPCFMPMMVMIFTILGSVMATAERKRRGVKTLIGRVLPTTISMTLFTLMMVVVLFTLLDVPLNGSIWIILAATALLIIDYQAIAIFLSLLTNNRHIAISLGGGYAVLAFTFSGLTFPTMAMAPILQFLSHLFPFTYYMQIMVEQALRGVPVAISIPNLGYMALFTLVPIFIYKRL
ncbi:MAG: ABC transporter permease [Alistipes sp.]|nr:ABC transporter permease [Alistipes sp.]MBQ9962530.1 ABC transporter permease [Alistipes sp.]